MNLEARRLLAELLRRHAQVTVSGGRLHLAAPRDAGGSGPFDDLRTELVEHKESLLELIGEGRKVAPASFAQERLWFLDQLQPGSEVWNVPIALHLSGDLDLAALEQALHDVVARHETLRTVFLDLEGQPAQHVALRAAPPLPVVDLTGLPRCAIRSGTGDGLGDSLATVEEISRQAWRPFDLAAGPLFRGLLWRFAKSEHLLLLVLHHAVSDGWSQGVLERDLASFYADRHAGRIPSPPPLERTYTEVSIRERRELRGKVLDEQLANWRRALANPPPPLELPTDRPRPAYKTYRGGARLFTVDAATTRALERLARRQKASLFMVALTAYAVLLRRHEGGLGPRQMPRDDLFLGSQIAHRNRTDVEELIGFFVNTLVLRIDFSGAPPFAVLVRRVREKVLTAFAHQDLPFEKLVTELAPDRDPSHNPLVQTTFVLQNLPAEEARFPGLEAKAVDLAPRRSQFDLALHLAPAETGDGLEGRAVYNADLFDAATTARLLRRFRTLLAAAVGAPETGIDELPLIDAAERHQTLVEWNDTERPLPAEETLDAMITTQARRTPEAVALVLVDPDRDLSDRDDPVNDREVTYAELDRRSNELARRLAVLGVTAETPVGLFVGRSPEMIFAVLAVMKAGGSYVPLDPEQPPARLAFVLADTHARLILTVEPLAPRLPDTAARIFYLDRWLTEPSPEASETASETAPGTPSKKPENHADQTLYTLYTSGSTGTPKGVRVPHRGVANYVAHCRDVLGLGPEDRVLQRTPFVFDGSLREVFEPFIAGARLVISTAPEVLDRDHLGHLIRSRGITAISFVPSLLAFALAQGGLDDAPTLRRVNSGGEILPQNLVRRLAETSAATLYNVYGPSETVGGSTIWRTDPAETDDVVSIGRPIANRRTYVLDRRGRPQPLGVPGEIAVAGPGSAHGYPSRPGQTAAAFVPDAFSGRPGERLYRTGDLGRHRHDGRLEFLGRRDEQVQIHGVRVELAEIEAVLMEHPGVRQVAVLYRPLEAGGPKHLVAYVVPAGRNLAAGAPAAGAPDPTAWRAHLAERLSAVMWPDRYLIRPELPRLPSGKVDRVRLAEGPLGPRISERPEGHPRSPARPMTSSEEIVLDVWQDLLRGGPIGLEDSFFELGGHSLLATQALARLRRMFGVELPLRIFFEKSTVQELAAAFDAAHRRDPTPPIRPRKRPREIPLSLGQERILAFDQHVPEAASYNLGYAWRIGDGLDSAALDAALREMARRHETLRTTFPVRRGQPRQRVADPPANPLLIRVHLDRLAGDDAFTAVRGLCRRLIETPFDLVGGPTWRCVLFRHGRRENVLLLLFHHLVSDGWSQGLFRREIDALYRAAVAGQASPLPSPELQYGDLVLWQRESFATHDEPRHLEAWRRRLAGLERPELPTDHAAPDPRRREGDEVEIEIPAVLIEALQRLADRHGASLYMVLLTAAFLWLHRITGSRDLALGTSTANRARAEIEGVFGYCANMLVMRLDLDAADGESDDATFLDLLAATRTITLEAFAHQELQLGRLIEDRLPNAAPGENPFFPATFALQNASGRPFELGDLDVEPFYFDYRRVHFDLSWHVWLSAEPDGPTAGPATAFLAYRTALFKRETIERWAADYIRLIGAVAGGAERPWTEL